MNQHQLDLALKKRQLQLRSAIQRRQLTQDAAALLPVFSVAEQIRRGMHWVRENPAMVTAAVVTVIVGRPRAVLRWSRRGWFAWMAWQKLNRATRENHGSRETYN